MPEPTHPPVSEDPVRELAAARAELAAARSRLREFDRLRRELRWDAAPPALRWLLPIARLLHRPQDPGPVPPPASMPEAMPESQPAASPFAPPPVSPHPSLPVAPTAGPALAPVPRSRLRGAALAAYRVARPIVRPVAWRSRIFLTGELMRELADVRAKLDLLLAHQSQHGSHSPAAPGSLDPGVARVAERMLLTMALEDRPVMGGNSAIRPEPPSVH